MPGEVSGPAVPGGAPPPPAAAARPPRPGRGARWLIGLGVAGLLAVSSFIFFVVAMTGLDWSSFDELDGSATATVLNVDHDDDRYDDSSGVSVDLSFRYDGDRYVVNLAWPDTRTVPARGDRVDIVFDTFDPEATAELDDGQGGGSGSSGDGEYQAGFRADHRADHLTDHRTVLTTPAALSAVDEGTDGSGGSGSSDGNRHAWAWWVSLGCGLASVVTVGATAVWATRIPARPPLYLPGVHYGPPGPHAPGPYPQYPPQQYPPQQYPPQQYPPQQYPPQQYPPQASPPYPPTPGGYPPPS